MGNIFSAVSTDAYVDFRDALGESMQCGLTAGATCEALPTWMEEAVWNAWRGDWSSASEIMTEVADSAREVADWADSMAAFADSETR